MIWERCQSIDQPFSATQSESGGFLVHGGSYVCGVSSSYLSLLPASYTTQEMDWKMQAPDLPSLNFIIRNYLRSHGFPETKNSQITHG